MTSTPPLDLDAIQARAARLYKRTATIDPSAHPDFGQLTDTDVPALIAEVRRLRAELAISRAGVFAEVANELEAIDFHPNAKATCTDLCRLLAGRFRQAGLNEIDAAVLPSSGA